MKKKLSSLEQRLLLDNYGKWLWILRLLPDYATHAIFGIALPPHERFLIRLFFSKYSENILVASRGTSKSFSVVSTASPAFALLHKDWKIAVLSASGFRGGKELFRDTDRLFNGELDSQDMAGPFALNCTRSGKVIEKDPSSWRISLRSNSNVTTVPTNNPEQLRGLRAHVVVIDERNTFDGETVDKVVRPMLNVGGNFRAPAAGTSRSKMWQVSTIDYTSRDWYPQIEAAKKLAVAEYEAAMARKRGDFREYHRLMNDNEQQLKFSSFSYTRMDYTDLLIPTEITANDGHVYKVEMPLDPGVEKKDVCRYDYRDDKTYYYTYPVEKATIEKPLLDGVVDEEIWLAEQRNVFVEMAGNVYPQPLIDKISERPIYQPGQIPGFPNIDDEFFAPLMYTCGDPCVLGVDVAREQDESSIIVIRLGEMATAAFDPTYSRTDSEGRALLGKTSWNHVCWAQTWKQRPYDELAEKIHEFRKRYNVLWTVYAGGIGMDKRGGGMAVRDHLALPKPKMLDNGMPDPNWRLPEILYDPEDKLYEHFSTKDPTKYLPMLRLIASSNLDNQDWVGSSKGLMQQGKLYIAYWRAPSSWALDLKINEDNALYWEYLAGYNGIRRLKRQLGRLQREITESGVIRFVMPGDRTKEDGKKDLWAGYIYATSMARAHLVGRTIEDPLPPMVAPVAVEIGKNYTGQGPWYVGGY